MIILVANLGSTSFKYRLYDLADRPTIGGEKELARGGVERIGAPESRVYARTGGKDIETVMPVPDHAVALRAALEQLTGDGGPLSSIDEVAAVGFKAVHGGRVSGVVRVTPDVLAAMEEMREVAPAHNPPYVKAMRLLGEKLPSVPLVAAFETGFHATIPDRNAPLCGADGMGGEAPRAPVGLPWGQPPVRRRPAYGARPGEASPPGDLLPPRRLEQRLLDPRREERRHVDGNEPAVGPATEQPGRRLRSVRAPPCRQGDRPELRGSARRAVR
jgi:hypothetical protein